MEFLISLCGSRVSVNFCSLGFPCSRLPRKAWHGQTRNSQIFYAVSGFSSIQGMGVNESHDFRAMSGDHLNGVVVGAWVDHSTVAWSLNNHVKKQVSVMYFKSLHKIFSTPSQHIVLFPMSFFCESGSVCLSAKMSICQFVSLNWQNA